MDYFEELQFLSIIEEEQEEIDTSLESATSETHTIDTNHYNGTKKSSENKSSKIPVPIGRNTSKNNEQQTWNSKNDSRTKEIGNSSKQNCKLDEKKFSSHLLQNNSNTGIFICNVARKNCIESVGDHFDQSFEFFEEESAERSQVFSETGPQDFDDILNENISRNNDMIIGVRRNIHSQETYEERMLRSSTNVDESSKGIIHTISPVKIDKNVDNFSYSPFTAVNQCPKSNPDFLQEDTTKTEVNHKTLSGNGIPSVETEAAVPNIGNEAKTCGEDIDFRRVVQSFLLSELKESSDNLNCTFYSLDPEGMTSCQDCEEPILEAPAEFRSGPEGLIFRDVSQVSVGKYLSFIFSGMKFGEVDMK